MTTPPPPPPSAVPAGWYPDPWQQAPQRWWDGSQWTGHTSQPAQPQQLHLQGSERIALVGTRHYDAALRTTAEDNPDRGSRTEASSLPFVGELVPEHENRHDPNAVSIRWKGQILGYLPREEAGRYRPVLDQLAASGATFTVDATIYAGHKGGSKWSVAVHLPTPDQLA